MPPQGNSIVDGRKKQPIKPEVVEWRAKCDAGLAAGKKIEVKVLGRPGRGQALASPMPGSMAGRQKESREDDDELED
jgi:hypothetical protein